MITVLITPWIKKFAISSGLLDIPSQRSHHKNPTPRLGGIGIYLGVTITTVLTIPISTPLLGLLFGSTFILILGIIDDIKPLPPLVKLLGQLCVACFAYSMDIQIQWLSSPFEGMIMLEWLSLPLTLFWIVGMINAINLLDGLDGLAGGICGISASILSLVAYFTGQFNIMIVCLILLGSCLGFLRYNFSNAQVFMGDSGSMFLGYSLACISIIGVLKSTVAFSFLVPIFIFAVPLSDTLFSIIRRIKKKQAIFKADNGHFHHRLVDIGLTPTQTTKLAYLISIILGLLAVMMSQTSGVNSWLLLATCIAILTTAITLCRRKSKAILSIAKFFSLQ